MKQYAVLFLSVALTLSIIGNVELFDRYAKANAEIQQQCPYEYGECPNPKCSNYPTLLRDYQLDLHMDTVRIYDAHRLVGSYISSWHNQMDSIILADNE